MIGKTISSRETDKHLEFGRVQTYFSTWNLRARLGDRLDGISALSLGERRIVR